MAALVTLHDATRARGRPLRHWTTNTIIEGAGAAAAARSYFMTVFAGRPAELGGTGIYEDDRRLVGGAWRITRRSVVLDANPS